MLQNFKLSKGLTIITIFAFFLSVILFFLPWGQKEYPLPELTYSGVEDTVYDFFEEINFQDRKAIDMVEAKINMALGRHIDYELNEQEFEITKKHIPVYTLQATADDGYTIVHVDPFEKKVVGTENIPIALKKDETVESFVEGFLGSGYVLVGQENYKSCFMQLNYDFLRNYKGHTRYTFDGPFAIDSLKEQVIVDVASSVKEPHSWYVISFMHTAQTASKYSLNNVFHGIIEFFSVAMVILIFGALGLVTLIHFIFKAVERKVAILLPLIITVFLSVFGFIFGYVYMGKIDWLTWVEVAISAWLVFFILAITVPKDTAFLKKYSFTQKASLSLSAMKTPILVGFCLAIILNLLSELFFGMASVFGGAWFSPVTFYEIYLIENVWLLPLFVLSIGITAAIMEETVFRRYLASAMDYIHPLYAVIASSLLWAILHIDYVVFPWYLRIIELTFIVGPFLYWIYKRYGFLTAIFCHYFYNSLISSLPLLLYRLDVGIVSLLLTLSPLLILFYKRNEKSVPSSPSLDNGMIR